MISVCIPTYNGEKYIKEQIDSILCQLDVDDEIVISDDMSTDETINILKSYNDNRIKIYIHQKEPNPYNGVFKTLYFINRNINNALKYAQGDYIFIADQDDIWMPNKVLTVVSMLKAGAGYVIHDYVAIDEDGIEICNYRKTHRRKESLLANLIRTNFKGCCVAFSKELYSKIYPIPAIAVEHDTWFGICAYKNKTISYIDDVLLKYRRYTGVVSPEDGKSTNSLWVKLLRRYYMIKAYFKY